MDPSHTTVSPPARRRSAQPRAVLAAGLLRRQHLAATGLPLGEQNGPMNGAKPARFGSLWLQTASPVLPAGANTHFLVHAGWGGPGRRRGAGGDLLPQPRCAADGQVLPGGFAGAVHGVYPRGG